LVSTPGARIPIVLIRGISEALIGHALLGFAIEPGQLPGQTSAPLTLGEQVIWSPG